ARVVRVVAAADRHERPGVANEGVGAELAHTRVELLVTLCEWNVVRITRRAGGHRQVLDHDSAIADEAVRQPQQRERRRAHVGLVDPRTNRAVLRHGLRLIGLERGWLAVESMLRDTG